MMKRSLEISDESQTKRRRVTFDMKRHTSSSEKTPSEEVLLQKLNQMNPSEQSRFEAFKQSTFSSKAVSNYIASCLIHSNNRSSRSRLNQIRLLGGGATLGADEGTSLEQKHPIPPSERAAIETDCILSSSSPHQTSPQQIQLSDLVAPGAASKITAIVTTLAKINAQRLMQSARIIATKDFKYDPNKPILPQHLLEAYRRQMRDQSGNNGFFMKGDCSSGQEVRPAFLSEYCCVGTVSGKSNGSSGQELDGINFITTDHEQSQIKYMAALHAQQVYDHYFVGEENKKENEDVKGNNNGSAIEQEQDKDFEIDKIGNERMVTERIKNESH